MTLSQDAFDDTLRVGTAFIIARLIREGGLPIDSVRADLQAAAASLLARAEPGSPSLAPRADASDEAGYAAEMAAVVARLADGVIGALAVGAPDAPWAPPDPPPATLADLDALAASDPAALPPFLRARVTRGGAAVGVLTLVPAMFLPPSAPGGWSWRSLAPGVSSRAAAVSGPLVAALEGLPDDAVTLLYPAVPGPPEGVTAAIRRARDGWPEKPGGAAAAPRHRVGRRKRG